MRCPSTVLARALAMHRDGASCGAIARALTEDDIPKPAGGHGWQRNHVWRLLGTAAARDLRAELD
ncbi:recombinase family protein [Nocardia sp. NPDC058518]|uniref:recombinase family protein n=1 Tax=Nocardia sp. NPDC058518 TaxID=3346534 RepID=UPI00364B51D7